LREGTTSNLITTRRSERSEETLLLRYFAGAQYDDSKGLPAMPGNDYFLIIDLIKALSTLLQTWYRPCIHSLLIQLVSPALTPTR